MLVRNVGHLMTTPAVLDGDGQPVPEGILDAMVSALAGDARPGPPGRRAQLAGAVRSTSSSRRCTGPTRWRSPTTCSPRSSVCSGLPANTVKVGIMDEERRTTLNLGGVHPRRQVPGRVHQHRVPRPHRRRDPHVDARRTDGPQGRHAQRSSGSWPTRTGTSTSGLACGLRGRAQIGKGMWAAPDRMADMLEQKIGHPRAGANCAWVPSPTAATLHATHYHRVDVEQRQAELAGASRATLDDLLAIPVAAVRRRGPPTSAEPRSTTTCRASSATSCAGSTRASAARRCPTSTASR